MYSCTYTQWHNWHQPTWSTYFCCNMYALMNIQGRCYHAIMHMMGSIQYRANTAHKWSKLPNRNGVLNAGSFRRQPHVTWRVRTMDAPYTCVCQQHNFQRWSRYVSTTSLCWRTHHFAAIALHGMAWRMAWKDSSLGAMEKYRVESDFVISSQDPQVVVSMQ